MNKITFAKLAIGTALLYQLLLIVLIFLRPDLPVYSTTISEWAIGKYGRIMQLAFIVSALSYFSFFYTLKNEIKGITGKIGLIMICISFIGTVGVGIFITDTYPPDFTLPTTLIHTICGTLAMLLFPIGILLGVLNISKRNETWKNYKST
ncbi:MAG: DUF998 domain-containing protein [bacterium]|nr:DUF998 domain-containing protein [bacterium]